MLSESFVFRTWAVVPLLIAVILGLWLAADGRVTTDESSYLYVAEYQDARQIIASDVQPSGIPGFVQGRILHVLFVNGVMDLVETGETAVRILQALHLILIVLNLVLIGKILRVLLPDLNERRAATWVVAMTPIILYLSLKTLPDNEALFAALIATWGLVRLAHGGSAAWTAAVAVGLAVAALTKNQMVFLPASFWLAVCLVPFAAIDRRRLVIYGALGGAASFLLTLAILEGLGIGLATYLASYRHPFENESPLLAKIMNTGTELGLVWFVLPVALLSQRRRELLAFLLWALIAMAPFLFFSGVEPRHVAVNLAAAAGLLALALEVINTRFDAWRRLSTVGKSVAATVAVIVLMASNASFLAIMPHKVDLGQLQTVLKTLDERYGAGRYVLLTTSGYTDFNIIRVLWPERDVRDVSTAVMWVKADDRPRADYLREYLGDRYLENLSDLETVARPLVMIGFEKTFAAANLQAMMNRVAPGMGDRLTGKVDFAQHLYRPYTEWLWRNPEIRLEPVAQVGNYETFEVLINGRDKP